MAFKKGFRETASRGVWGVHLLWVPEKHRGWRDSEEKVKGEMGPGKYGETVLLGDYTAEELGSSAFLPGNTAPAWDEQETV